ncbi:MAG: HAMP domain-containing protein, partial [bacterium]|nr:HAMP domain-containing protein [bacterium]
MIKMLKNLSFSKKIMLTFGITCMTIILAVGLTTYLTVKKNIEDNINDELQRLTNSIYNLIETTINTSVENYLRSVAEKARSLAQYHYSMFEKGVISEEEAYLKTKRALLAPTFGKIGETGYIAAVNGNGITVIHPKSEGMNAVEFPFIREAIKRKNGYIEYQWKNPGEEKPRKKAGWFAYFKPWDLVIWATSYKDEFDHLVDLDSLKKKVLATQPGERKHIFVLDNKGAFVVRPKTDKTESPQQPGHDEREKIVFSKHLKITGWIICSGVYTEELYAPLRSLTNRFIITAVVTFILIVLFSVFLGKSISKPVKQLAEGAEAIGRGNLDVRISAERKDEIGFLSETFNK